MHLQEDQQMNKESSQSFASFNNILQVSFQAFRKESVQFSVEIKLTIQDAGYIFHEALI